MNINKIKTYEQIITQLELEKDSFTDYTSPSNFKNDRVQGNRIKKDFYDMKLEKLEYLNKKINYYRNLLVEELLK